MYDLTMPYARGRVLQREGDRVRFMSSEICGVLRTYQHACTGESRAHLLLSMTCLCCAQAAPVLQVLVTVQSARMSIARLCDQPNRAHTALNAHMKH